MSKVRSEYLDFLRGLCIIEMVMVHSACYLPFPLKQVIVLMVDGAAEGFLFLAGLMIGWRIVPLYMTMRKSAASKMIRRALEILFVHYLLVISIEFSLRSINGNKFKTMTEVLTYISNVVLWQEQPYILDILPIFVTMFAVTPVLLELYNKRLEVVILVGSSLVFVIGIIWPYVISVKHTVAFPAIQWQIYFVIGIVLGIRYDRVIEMSQRNLRTCAYVAMGSFIILVFFRHGVKVAPDWVKIFVSFVKYDIKKFPISFWGFMYSLSLLATIWTSTLIYFQKVEKPYIFRVFITTLGRNSLLAFSLHVYFDYCIKTIDRMLQMPMSITRGLILGDVIAIFFVIACWEKVRSGCKRMLRDGWA